MNVLLNKRGLEIAIGTVAIIAVVLLVLIVVIGFFLGGFGKSGGGIAQIVGEGEKGAGEIQLEHKCLGAPRASNSYCRGSGALATLCDSPGQSTGAVKATLPACDTFTTSANCNGIPGCYWGYGQ